MLLVRSGLNLAAPRVGGAALVRPTVVTAGGLQMNQIHRRMNARNEVISPRASALEYS